VNTKYIVTIASVLALTACGGEDNGADKDNNDTYSDSLSIVSGSTINGSLDINSDEFDFYHFNLLARSHVSIDLTSSGDNDFDLTLQSQALDREWYGDLSADHLSHESIDEMLEPGLYYIKLEAWDGSGQYQLRMEIDEDTTSLPDHDYNNPELIISGETLSGAITLTDIFDAYEFYVNFSSPVDIRVSTTSSDYVEYDIYLYNEFDVIKYSDKGTTYQSAVISEILAFGNYTLVIDPRDNAVFDYQVTLEIR
jgi:hypothetical protein